MSRQALWPSAQASHDFPTPVGPSMIRFCLASTQPPVASLWNSARSRPRGVAVVDVLDRRLVAQPGVAQPRLEPAVLAVGEFAIEQQAEPLGVIEFGAARAGGQFLEGARHAGKAELAQLVERGMGQQGGSPQW